MLDFLCTIVQALKLAIELRIQFKPDRLKATRVLGNTPVVEAWPPLSVTVSCMFPTMIMACTIAQKQHAVARKVLVGIHL